MIPEIRGPILNVLLSDDLSDEPYQVKILTLSSNINSLLFPDGN